MTVFSSHLRQACGLAAVSLLSTSTLASNPTPYHVSLASLTLNGKKIDGEMIAPRATLTFDLPGQAGNTLSGEFVNDYGAVNKFDAVIK